MLDIILILLIAIFILSASIQTGRKYRYWNRGVSGTKNETYGDLIMGGIICIAILAGLIAIIYSYITG